VTWFFLGLRDANQAFRWKCTALFLAVVHSVLYVGYELLARLAIERGVHEVWIMAATFAGFGGLILWRRPTNER
jgi:hypothetical protein